MKDTYNISCTKEPGGLAGGRAGNGAAEIQGQDVLLVWIIVGQGPAVLAAGAELDFEILSLNYLFYLSLSLGAGSIKTWTLSHRALNNRRTNI